VRAGQRTRAIARRTASPRGVKRVLFRWSVCDQLQFAKCIKLSPVDCRTRLWGAVWPGTAVVTSLISVDSSNVQLAC